MLLFSKVQNKTLKEVDVVISLSHITSKRLFVLSFSFCFPSFKQELPSYLHTVAYNFMTENVNNRDNPLGLITAVITFY